MNNLILKIKKYLFFALLPTAILVIVSISSLKEIEDAYARFRFGRDITLYLRKSTDLLTYLGAAYTTTGDKKFINQFNDHLKEREKYFNEEVFISKILTQEEFKEFRKGLDISNDLAKEVENLRIAFQLVAVRAMDRDDDALELVECGVRRIGNHPASSFDRLQPLLRHSIKQRLFRLEMPINIRVGHGRTARHGHHGHAVHAKVPGEFHSLWLRDAHLRGAVNVQARRDFTRELHRGPILHNDRVGARLSDRRQPPRSLVQFVVEDQRVERDVALHAPSMQRAEDLRQLCQRKAGFGARREVREAEVDRIRARFDRGVQLRPVACGTLDFWLGHVPPHCPA